MVLVTPQSADPVRGRRQGEGGEGKGALQMPGPCQQADKTAGRGGLNMFTVLIWEAGDLLVNRNQ